MGSGLEEKAEARLAEALRDTGAVDPRAVCREFLRELKQRGQDPYDDAISAYQKSVVARIGREKADPLKTWLLYACELAERIRPGRDVVIDGTGRATPLEPPPSWRDLILHLPRDSRSPCLIVGQPPELTRAQRATVAVLVTRKVSRPGIQ
ncbi:MAG: hypothetical protein OXT72_09080 [Gammaproteobacteria bacterium]|nr:hypothetical protein [Gammaproteobacteria bacterium]MDE0247535.1 hypothetical protein [Gammaproteobacteria bacterium]